MNCAKSKLCGARVESVRVSNVKKEIRERGQSQH